MAGLIAMWALGCDGADATTGAFGGAGGSNEAGAGGGGGSSSTVLACEVASPFAPAPPLVTPMFVEVTETAGLAGDVTYGFGRVMVVDLDADGFDDLVGLPAHDGQHGLPDAFAKLVLRNRGDGTFEDITARSGLADVRAGLLLFGDIDNDGDQDLYAGVIESQGLEDQGLWLNDGGTFSQLGPAGTEATQLECGDLTCTERQIAGTFADFDGDGMLDLYVGGWFWSDGVSTQRYSPPPRDDVYRGLGDGTFESVTDELPAQDHPLSNISSQFGRAAMGVAAADYDDDGDVDLFVANYGAGRPVGPLAEPLCEPPRYWDQNLLWRNGGGFDWSDESDEAGVAATMRGPSGVEREPPLTIGAECPADVQGSYASPIGGNNFTPVWGDLDNDGDLDLLVGAIAHPDYLQSDPTSLFVNQGSPGIFVDEASSLGLVYREDEKHVAFVDVDGDGWLDVAATGFRNADENELRLYRQEAGELVLLDAATSGVEHRRQEGMAWFDYDRDGDLDLYIAEDAGSGHLYRNDTPSSSLSFLLEALAPRDATGAVVTLESSSGRQRRDAVGPTGHYNQQPSRVLSFGLGGDACARDVRIRWPNGEITELGDLAAGQALRVIQGAGVSRI